MQFNPINNINIQNNLSSQKAGLVQGSQDGSASSGQNITQQPQTPMPQQTINPSLMYDFQMAKMDNQTVVKYLQNLLNLPNSIDKFVEQLNSKNIDPKNAKILVENLISTKALGEFLNQNSTQAISKLLQTISTSLKSGVNDVSQLKEVLAILTTIQSSTNLNTNSLKELLLLYIPLNHQVFDKDIDLENLEEDEKQKIKTSKLSILFETINFSNILCCLNSENNDVLVEFYLANEFPTDKIKNIIQTLSKEININPYIEFKKRKTTENNTSNQNFKILSDGFISSDLLILSHLIIKSVFKIDESFA